MLEDRPEDRPQLKLVNKVGNLNSIIPFTSLTGMYILTGGYSVVLR